MDAKLQNEIFKECKPETITINGQNFKIIEDMRRLERIIDREILKGQQC
jgi:hypothetical protein